MVPVADQVVGDQRVLNLRPGLRARALILTTDNLVITTGDDPMNHEAVDQADDSMSHEAGGQADDQEDDREDDQEDDQVAARVAARVAVEVTVMRRLIR